MRRLARKIMPFMVGISLLLPSITVHAERVDPVTEESAVTINATATEFLTLSVSGARTFNFNNINLSEGWTNFSSAASPSAETVLAVTSSRPYAITVIADDIFRELENQERTLPIERLRVGARSRGSGNGAVPGSAIRVTHASPSIMTTGEPILLAEVDDVGTTARQLGVQFAFLQGNDIEAGTYATSVTFSAFQR